MKKVIIIGISLAAVITVGILIKKNIDKKKQLQAPEAQSDKKQTLMQDIMDLVADIPGVGVTIEKSGLSKLNETDLVSLKVAFTDMKNEGSKMSPANKMVITNMVLKMIKK